MAFGLDDPERQRAVLIGLLVLGAAYVFWQYVYSPVREERIETEARLESLVRVNDQARALSQPQRMRELRAREEEHEIQLAAYETMLPARSEVGDLLEDIAGAALEQDVGIVEFAPLAPIEGEVLTELSFEIEVQYSFYEDVARRFSNWAQWAERLPEGERLRLRYRVWIHAGEASPERLAAEFDDYRRIEFED